MAVDTLYTGGRVRTFDPAQPWAEAVGVTGDRISYVGTAADAPAARRTVHLEGRLVTPASPTPTITSCSATTTLP